MSFQTQTRFCVYVIVDLSEKWPKGRVSRNARFKRHLIKRNFRRFLYDSKNTRTKLLKSLSLPFPRKRGSPSLKCVHLILYKKICDDNSGRLKIYQGFWIFIYFDVLTTPSLIDYDCQIFNEY